jgi:hypothetical protein
MPVGGRPRQLSVRTLLLGLVLSIGDGRQGQLVRAHQALTGLPTADKFRLGVIARWRRGTHLLTYRQVERTFKVLTKVLESSGGAPGNALSDLVDSLIDASVPDEYREASSSLAVDWTDQESWSRPPPEKGGDCADPDASWGHRRGHAPGQKDELYFGYYLQFATMVADTGGNDVPELVRAMSLTSCHLDPPAAMVPVLERLVSSAFVIGDVLADCGYSNRVPSTWAIPLRRLGARLVTDLHPHDRGPKGTYAGALICNGNLYCPATPAPLLRLGPLGPGATDKELDLLDRRSKELASYKLGRMTRDDADGYHRVACPATEGKIRCPLRAESMSLSHAHPEVGTPPEAEEAPCCCRQSSITVPPEVNAKTAQRHDYPSPAHRKSYGRRSAAERTNATVKDPSSTDITRGSIRVTGQSAITIVVVAAVVVRNIRIVNAFEARRADDERRQAAGLATRTRRRRRRTLEDLAS